MPPHYLNPEDEKKSFSELLAERANTDKEQLVYATLQAFKDGDSNAMKLVTQALLDSQFSEESQLEISDGRFLEIICAIADHCRAVKD